ncbi:MAG: alpha/beta hydrolase [Pseudomonadales bacterium]
MWTLLDWLIGPATALFLFFANWGDEQPRAESVISALYTHAAYADQKDQLDIYISPSSAEDTNASALKPVLVFIHGGGLMIGDKSDFKQLGHKFASNGYTTVLVNHRLSPGVSHPSHIEDIATAFAWVHSNITSYGGDPERVFVSGHSSGGYLAMLLGTDARYLAEHGLSIQDIRGVAAISGFFHVERLATERPKTVWSEISEKWPDASPANHLGPDVPPTLLLYADNDNDARKQESIDLADKMKEYRSHKVEVMEIADRNHASISAYMMTKGDMTSELLLDFMQQNL